MRNRILLSRAAAATAALIAALTTLTALPGCGGGHDSPDSAGRAGRVRISIQWPAASRSGMSRYIPAYAASLAFEMYLKSDPTQRYQLVANRPDDRPSTQNVEFGRLIPAGLYVLAGAARSDLGGQGATVASAVSEVQVQADVEANVDLTFQSTIKTIEIQGQPLRVPAGSTLTLTGRALDPDGKVLLLPAGALKWTLVSGSQFGSLTSDGVLTASAPGTMRVRLAEPDAGIASEADVEIVAPGSGGGGLANSGWPKAFGDLLNTSRAGSGPTATGALKWKLDGVGPNTFTPVEPPAVAPDGTVYVASGNHVVAVDPTAGSVKWQSQSFGQIASGLSLGEDGTIYCVSQQNGVQATAIDRSTGNAKWTTAIDSESGFSRAPAVGSNGLVYVQSSRPNGQAGGQVYALDAATGAIRWQAAYGGAYGFGLTIGPDGTVYTAGDNGWFYALDGATGAKKWQNQTWMRYNVPALDSKGVVYGNIYRGFVRAFNAATGQKIWDADIGSGRISECPVAVGPDGTVYTGTNNFPADGARITAVDGGTGAIKWSVVVDGVNVGGFAIASDGTVYVTIQNSGKLHALNPVDGSVKWSFQGDGASPTGPSVGADGTVYFTSFTNSGPSLYAVK